MKYWQWGCSLMVQLSCCSFHSTTPLWRTAWGEVRLTGALYVHVPAAVLLLEAQLIVQLCLCHCAEVRGGKWSMSLPCCVTASIIRGAIVKQNRWRNFAVTLQNRAKWSCLKVIDSTAVANKHDFNQTLHDFFRFDATFLRDLADCRLMFSFQTKRKRKLFFILIIRESQCHQEGAWNGLT